MKKLLLIIATSAAFLSSAVSFADENQPADKNQPADTMKANPNERRFYLKVEGGTSNLSTASPKPSASFNEINRYRTTTKTTGIFGVGVGYYISEDIRADLELAYLSRPEFKDSATSEDNAFHKKTQININLKRKGSVASLLLNAYVDSPKVGIFQFFAGAGIGLAQVKENFTGDSSKVVTDTLNIFKQDIVTRTDSNISGKASSINVAYQITIGAVANVTNGVKVEFAYSWKDYGIAEYEKKSSSTQPIGFRKDVIVGSVYKGHNLMAGIRFDL